ncbi:MAG: hypothetical protein MUC36_13585 [Planctomycetes bacterium]|jgi:hypothetical protein|nr:hypothetical protein [Planctomycetota bacterium]
MLRTTTMLVALAGVWTLLPAQSDFAAFRARIDQRLKEHAFFSRIKFTTIERPPFVFLVQRAAGDVEGYEASIVNGYIPFVTELERLFKADYVTPNGLAPAAEAGGYAIAVLDSAGSYLNFRTAIGDPSLANARAHYTPSLQLAVTYQDAFARHATNAEERHALLHEFVHALQHAYGKDGAMPKPVWYTEGLADYRAGSTNMAKSLAQPPLQMRHLQALGFGHGNRAGRFYLSPINDLIAATSYGDAIQRAQKRNNIAVREDVLLGMFYAQSELLVRFLHEAEGGKWRPGFVRYAAKAQAGATGIEAFLGAFELKDEAALLALEITWLQWLGELLKPTFPRLANLGKAAPIASGPEPAGPPRAFDATRLAWLETDAEGRLHGARKRAGEGDFDGAARLLPGAEEKLPDGMRALVARERGRLQAAIELRTRVLTDVTGKQSQLALTAATGQVRGKALRLDGGEIVLLVGKAEQRFPLQAIGPAVLVREGNRLKAFDGANRWLEVWLRWLQAQKLGTLKSSLALEYAKMQELRGDLTTEHDPQLGVPTDGWERLQQIAAAAPDPARAKADLDQFRAVLTTNRAAAMFTARREALEAMATTLAERAFDPTDPTMLGIHGKVAKLDGGRIQVEYPSPKIAPDCDFWPWPKEVALPGPLPDTKLAYNGPTGFTTNEFFYRLVGSGYVRWCTPLSGRQSVEFDYILKQNGWWTLMLCAEPKASIMIDLSGEVTVLDPESGIIDTIGEPATLILDQKHTLRIDFDGESKLEVRHDGKLTATVSAVGTRRRGDIAFLVHASTPLLIENLKISGKPDASDLQRVREEFAARTLGELWP